MAPPGTVVVRDLWEKFRIYHTRPRGLKDRLFRFERARYEDFYALKGINLDLAPGDTLAVLGHNGSGKSTLLKCLAGILPPDKGEVALYGKVASLLELGAGFHGDLSGRENVYLNGSILGLQRREIDEAFGSIVKFAGIEEFIDTPVRNYSSGMYVRLGFSVATHVDPDVLLIDEILAVGDAEFQAKCLERMDDFQRRGKTIVLVTHDLGAAVRLCGQAILLERGSAVASGPTRKVVEGYRRRILGEAGARAAEAREQGGRRIAHITEVSLSDQNGNETREVASGGKYALRLVVLFADEIDSPSFGYSLRSSDGVQLYETNTAWRGIRSGSFKAGDEIEIVCWQRLNLVSGQYVFSGMVGNADGSRMYEVADSCLTIAVQGSPGPERGYVDLEAQFEMGKREMR